MTKVIILGHGGYGSAMKRNLAMLIGEMEDYYYIDFNEQDDLSILQGKIGEALSKAEGVRVVRIYRVRNYLQAEGCDVLFCCDVAGGSPFREAASICAEHPNYCCVAGVNTSAYTELSFNLELTASELADMAIEVAKATMLRFPEAE